MPSLPRPTRAPPVARARFGTSSYSRNSAGVAGILNRIVPERLAAVLRIDPSRAADADVSQSHAEVEGIYNEAVRRHLRAFARNQFLIASVPHCLTASLLMSFFSATPRLRVNLYWQRSDHKLLQPVRSDDDERVAVAAENTAAEERVDRA